MAYKHQPLEDPSNEFRLIRVKGRSETDNCIRIELERFSMDSSPPYVALSYTWGKPTPTFNVMISSAESGYSPLEIRENLHDFLVSASDVPLNTAQTFDRDANTRELVDAEWLWIDQITIDQSNLNERAHQVQRMADIYTNAQATFIWLGKSFDQSDNMMKHLNLNSVRARSFFEEGGVSDSDGPNSVGTPVDISSPSSAPDDLLSHAKHMGGLPTIRRVLELPYWSRLWINQEIAMARRVLVMIGNRFCDFADFEDGISHLAEMLRPWTATMDVRQTYKTNMRRVNMKLGLHRHQPGSWRDAATYMDSECSDLRDKVYGLMALVKPNLRMLPDYTAPAEGVLTDMLRRLCREEFEDQRLCKGDHTCMHGKHGLMNMQHTIWDWSVALHLAPSSEVSASRQRNLIRFWALKAGLLPQLVRPKELDKPGRSARPGGFLYKIAKEEHAAWLSSSQVLERSLPPDGS